VLVISPTEVRGPKKKKLNFVVQCYTLADVQTISLNQETG